MDTAITKEMYKEMGIDGKVYSFGQEIAESLKQRFEEIDRVAEYNQLKVVPASATASAWVPQAICGRTRADSVWNVAA